MKTKLCQLILALTASLSLVSCADLPMWEYNMQSAASGLTKGHRYTRSGQWVAPGQSHTFVQRSQDQAYYDKTYNGHLRPYAGRYASYAGVGANSYYSRPTPVSYVRSAVPHYNYVTHRSPQSRPASPYAAYHQNNGLIMQAPQ